jgi:hypothetical protein
VNDEGRRRWVVKWMYGAGQQWLTTDHTPTAGSDLDLDDTASDQKVSPVVGYGIVSAIDHLGSVVDAMVSGQPMRHYAHFTTLRTALLSSARAQWILKPDSSVDRQLRCLQVRFINADEQRKAVNGFAGALLDATVEQARRKAVAALDAEVAALEARALALGTLRLTAPKDMISMLRDDLVDANTWDGSAMMSLWRTGSAAAHGYYWTETQSANPRRFDEQSFNMALSGAWLFITAATTLYDKRATAPASRS